jgi:hypothetical protein
MIGWKYPTTEIKNKNNDVPKGTEDKVLQCSGLPNNKCCLIMAHMWPKHVAT